MNILSHLRAILIELTLAILMAARWLISNLFPPVGDNETPGEFAYRICTQAMWAVTAALVIVVLVIIALCL